MNSDELGFPSKSEQKNALYFRFQHYLSKMASSCPLTDDNQTENDETNEEDELDPRVQVTY